MVDASCVLARDLEQQPQERWPFYDADEIAAVAAVLASGKVNQWTGRDVADFENACCRAFEAPYCIALANGTLALELALRAFGIGPGDEVIVTPRSFVASASCVRIVGATPVFADVDRDSGNITPHSVKAVLSSRTRAIIPVHLAGWPCDMPGLMDLARHSDLKVIEDCAQAHGAMIDGRSVGSFGDAAAFSFCQDKIISTGGEGGATLFRDEKHWDWAWSYKDHGKDWRRACSPSQHQGFRWLHDSIGTNWRLTGMQAALGSIHLAKLAKWHATRARNADIWINALARLSTIRLPMPGPGLEHGFYKLYFYLDLPDAAQARDEILRLAAADGLRVFSGSCSEVYREGAFSDLPLPDLPIARSLADASLMVEVHPTLDPDLLLARAGRVSEIVATVTNG